MTEPVTVIGAGLAGSEAAWQLARLGIPVRLAEMRPLRRRRSRDRLLCGTGLQ